MTLQSASTTCPTNGKIFKEVKILKDLVAKGWRNYPAKKKRILPVKTPSEPCA
jgi:hypothetical protein